MHDLAHRLAVIALLATGLLTLLLAPSGPADLAALAHRDVMLGLMGVGLVAATWLPALRLPAIAAALLGKVSFLAIALVLPAAGPATPLVALQVVLLLAAGAVFVREARQEARWDSALPMRQEG